MFGRIEAPHFVAGVKFTGAGICHATAPIVKYMKGWDCSKVQDYCSKKGWKIEIQ